MSAADYAYYNHELREFGYYTEDGVWHQCSAETHDNSAVV
jgi:hypothetical protein